MFILDSHPHDQEKPCLLTSKIKFLHIVFVAVAFSISTIFNLRAIMPPILFSLGLPLLCVCVGGGGEAVAQSVERVTPSEEVVDSIPALSIRSLLVGSVSV